MELHKPDDSSPPGAVVTKIGKPQVGARWGEENALPICKDLNLFRPLFPALGLSFNLELEREIVEMQWVAERA